MSAMSRGQIQGAPSGSEHTNNVGIGSITICHSSRSRLLTSNLIPRENSHLGIYVSNDEDKSKRCIPLS
jgi:hypothetical protein